MTPETASDQIACSIPIWAFGNSPDPWALSGGSAFKPDSPMMIGLLYFALSLAVSASSLEPRSNVGVYG